MLNGIFDSHAHYDSSKFDTDRDTLLSGGLKAAGVEWVVNIGNDYPSIDAGVALSRQYENVYCTVGHHPHTAKDVRPDYLTQLETLCKLPKVVAIGEIGLDYHYDFSPREVQGRVFREQLALAKALDIPVVIHSREATADTMAMLREFRPKGVVHCFSGSAETAREVLALGMYIGFTGVVTFKGAKKALETAAAVPLERLVVETDCPYMAPVPHRGERCDSTMLPCTIATLAELKGVSEQELCHITAENAKRLYEIS